jgi:hypothetical protein
MTKSRGFRRGQRLPTVLRSDSQRRELVVSLAIVALLQAAIAAALVVSALQTYRMWRQGVPYIPGEIARVVPVFILLGALVAVFAAARTTRRLRAVQHAPLENTPEA